MICVYGCTIAISWFAAHYIVAGDMTTGNLTTLLSYIMQILMSLMMLSMIFVMIAMSSASVHRISQVLVEQPDIHNPQDPVEEVKDGSIDFNHVNFSYRKGSDKNALSDIDIHIKSGETIGIIGGTGSGKSSFVNLICRLYDVSSGSVCVGGVDVREYDTEALRNQVSVVLQKNVLFSGTILENLRWGQSGRYGRGMHRGVPIPPARMNLSSACPINITPISSAAAQMFPAARNRGSALQGRC